MQWFRWVNLFAASSYRQMKSSHVWNENFCHESILYSKNSFIEDHVKDKFLIIIQSMLTIQRYGWLRLRRFFNVPTYSVACWPNTSTQPRITTLTTTSYGTKHLDMITVMTIVPTLGTQYVYSGTIYLSRSEPILRSGVNQRHGGFGSW